MTSITKVHVAPIYNELFGNEADSKQSKSYTFNDLQSKKDDFIMPLSARDVDFSVENRSRFEKLKSGAYRLITLALEIGVVASFVFKISGFILPTKAFLVLQKHIAPLFNIGPNLSALRGLSSLSLIEGAARIATFVAKALFSVWVIRYFLQRFVMLPLFPIQSRILQLFVSFNHLRVGIASRLTAKGFLVRDVVLQKNGVRYSALLIGHKDTIKNGKWALQATGNAEPIEDSAPEFANIYKKFDCNILLINGPGVGKNQGQATPQSMGEAQEIGLTFLETAIKAKKIVVAGRSLGGAAIGQAILQHEFINGINYLVIQQMTFSKSSSVCAKIVGRNVIIEEVVRRLVKWVGCEMDTVAASKKLQTLKIQEIVVQRSKKEIPKGKLPEKGDFETDGPIIAEASLGHGLIDSQLTDGKIFHCLERAHHMTNDAISISKEQIVKL